MSEKLTYEQAIKRLEEIAALMEAGEIPLDEAIRLFEEGTKLSVLCNQYLEQAEQKITELTKED